MRIGVLGGSFDPVHHGHLLAARGLREALGLDEVRLIPAAEQPFKTGRHGASGAARAAMAELATQGEPGLAVDRIEVERPGPSYTVDTLEALAARWPGAAITLLLGADAAVEFDAWRAPERIRALAEVVVFTRAGAPSVPRWREVTLPAVDISATAIRARVRAGLSIRYLVPDPVAAYIAAHRLYV